MKYGASNQLDGVVKEIKKGNVMAQVNIDIPAASRMGSVNDLSLKIGDKVKLIVKAINILVVKE